MKIDDEAQRFDAALGKILSVSHDELKRREKEWKKQRKQRKRAKSSPASHAATDHS
jgi:hypothetical protein